MHCFLHLCAHAHFFQVDVFGQLEAQNIHVCAKIKDILSVWLTNILLCAQGARVAKIGRFKLELKSSCFIVLFEDSHYLVCSFDIS